MHCLLLMIIPTAECGILPCKLLFIPGFSSAIKHKCKYPAAVMLAGAWVSLLVPFCNPEPKSPWVFTKECSLLCNVCSLLPPWELLYLAVFFNAACVYMLLVVHSLWTIWHGTEKSCRYDVHGFSSRLRSGLMLLNVVSAEGFSYSFPMGCEHSG